MESKSVVISGASALTSAGVEDAAIAWGRKPNGSGGGARTAPFSEFAADEQVAARSDQRAMGRTMLAAVFTAGRALDQARLKGDDDRLRETQLLTAGKCVERDDTVDQRALDLVSAQGWSQADVNQVLAQNLRPSLFLAQLPNLISANISIVHGVLGRSQTFFGEELAGGEILATAFQRLSHGEAERCLVGGVFSADSQCVGEVLDDPALGSGETRFASGAAFVVLETEASARGRGHVPLARIVCCDRADFGAEEPAGPAWLSELLARVGGPLAGLACYGPGDAGSLARLSNLSAACAPNTPPTSVGWVGDGAAMLEAAAPVGIAALAQRAAQSPSGEGAGRLALIGLGRGYGQTLLVMEPWA